MEKDIFQFGAYELDAAKRELRRGGMRVDLQPRVFDLLHYLVQHRERAVGKDELQDAVWPGMIVTETALTRAVMKARKAVGDDANTQSHIRTVHGHGYRFVAAVETGHVAEAERPADRSDAGVEVATATDADTGQVRKRRRWLAGALALLAVTAACLGLWRALTPPEAKDDLRVAVLPLRDATEDPEYAWTRLGLMSLTSNTLAADAEIPVVEDSNVLNLTNGLGWDGRVDGPEAAKVLSQLRDVYGATHIVAMELVRDGSMLRMNYTIFDDREKSWQGTMVGRDGIELTHGVVQSIYAQLVGKSRLGKTPYLVSEDPFNNEVFARGMDFSLEGRCADAVPYFRLIVEQEPGLFAPRLELASCLRILGEPDEAETLLNHVVAEQREQGDNAGLGTSLMLLGILQNRTGRLDEAESSYRQALEAARAVDDADLTARILHNLAILAKSRGNWSESAEYLDRAVLEYQRAGREVMPGQLWSGYANLSMEQGKLNEADEYLLKALEAFRSTGDQRNEAMMLNNRGYLRRLQGRLDEAEDYHLQSLAIREEIRDRVGVGRIYSMLALVYSARGDFEQAQSSAERALAIARETRDRLFEGTSLAQMAEAEQSLGLTEQAREHYRESKAILASFQDSMRVLELDIRLAEMDLQDGMTQEAEAAALAALSAAKKENFIQPEIDALVLLGDVDIAMDRIESGMDRYQQALARVRDSGFSARENTILVKLANVLMDQGALEETAPMVGALARLEADAASLKTQARYAWLTGDPGQAAEYMANARERSGSHWDPEDERLFQQYAGAESESPE